MIQVVYTDISQATQADYLRLYAMASRERKERADRYLRREDALRCVTADALLQYATGCRDWKVARTPEGKPYLPDAPDFHFSLTHSGDYVAIAYGSSPVGVDIERIREDGIRPGIAQRFYTPAEQAFATTPEKFYQIWSMKESYLKFLGTGLAYPLQSFDVLSEPLAAQFHIAELPGHTLTVFSTDYLKKVEEISILLLISSIDMV